MTDEEEYSAFILKLHPWVRNPIIPFSRGLMREAMLMAQIIEEAQGPRNRRERVEMSKPANALKDQSTGGRFGQKQMKATFNVINKDQSQGGARPNKSKETKT